MANRKNGLWCSLLNIKFICCLSLLFLMTSGCTPLRKKFTREKKKDKEANPEFIPVLDPVDYPEKIFSSQEKYKHHYSLWKVWDRDFLQVLEGDGSDKRQKFLLAQTIEQLVEMQSLLNEEKQEGLGKMIDVIRDVQQSYERSSVTRSKFSIRSKLSRNASEIRKQYSPKVIFNSQ